MRDHDQQLHQSKFHFHLRSQSNQSNGFAAQLIEEAGLKARCVGGAVVSEKHANFIINTGKATAADIENLFLQVREAVEEFHGVTLEMEVQVVGEHEVSGQ